MEHSVKLLTNSDIHNYYTRNNDKLRLPNVRRNWGKQRVCYQSMKNWSSLDKETRNAPSVRIFKQHLLSRCFNLQIVFVVINYPF